MILHPTPESLKQYLPLQFLNQNTVGIPHFLHNIHTVQLNLLDLITITISGRAQIMKVLIIK